MYAFSSPFHMLLLALVEHKIVHRSTGRNCVEYEALVTLLDSKKQDVYLFKTPVPCFLEYIHNPLIIMCSVDDLNALVLYLECNMRIFYQMDFEKWTH